MATQKARVASAQEQDISAFQTFFLQHYQRVYRVIFRLVGDPALADDLALESFWRLWKHKFRANENLEGWLFRVATNLGYNALRADKRRNYYESLTQNEPGSQLDPSVEAIRAEERDRVRRVLMRLPPRDAQMLILRHSDFSYKEIAAALGLATSSVGTLLARAEREFARFYERGE